ncbi:MAG: hypothetical protein QF495_05770, partial [SAR324 cluster bacterium]|nr:hypothetical protein [SAR324 cluster bacterium]
MVKSNFWNHSKDSFCFWSFIKSLVVSYERAFHFVRNQVQEWKTNGVYLIGHSAGAHLAGEIIGRKFFGREKDQSRLKGSILLSGIYEPEVV